MNPPVIPAENPDLIDLVKKRDRRFLVSWLTATALTTALAVACFGLAMNAYGLLVAILLALSLILLPFLLCGGMVRTCAITTASPSLPSTSSTPP